MRTDYLSVLQFTSSDYSHLRVASSISVWCKCLSDPRLLFKIFCRQCFIANSFSYIIRHSSYSVLYLHYPLNGLQESDAEQSISLLII